MIKTGKYEYRDPSGHWHGTIAGVDVEPNQFYDPEKQNSTEHTLTLHVECRNIDDPEDTLVHTQRFIAPLFGVGIFQQLIDAVNVEGLVAGDSFNEEVLVGQNIDLELGQNKKGYATIVAISASTEKPSKKASSKKKSEGEDEGADEDIPNDFPWEKPDEE